MQVIIGKEPLLKAVHRTLGVVDRKAMMPILSHMLLLAEQDGITISATDLEISYRGSCPAEVQQAGALAMPAHYFHNLLKGLPGDKLELTGERGKMKVQAENYHYLLNGLDPADFPAFPEVNGLQAEFEAQMLKEMIDKTIFSAFRIDEEAHNTLDCIQLERVEKDDAVYFRMVSTDGHRLTLIDRRLPEDDQVPFLENAVLIPRKGALEISRILEGEKNAVGLSLSATQLAIKVSGKTLLVRLLDRKFPDYRRILPEGYEFGFSVDRNSFLGILRRMSMLSSERFKGIVLEIGPESMEATFENPDVGDGSEKLPVSLVCGNDTRLPIRVGFNAKYLMELLSVMRNEKVLLEVNSADAPCRIRAEGDSDYFGMIMPMSM